MSEWKKVKLKDCCIKIGSGSTPKGGSMVYVNSGTSLIRSQNVYNLSFDYNGLTHITEDAANKLKGVTVFNEDILLNITGDSVARTCIVPKEVLPARVNQHVAIIRTDRKKMNWRFLNYYLASPKMQAHMLSLAVGKGASRNALTKQMIENFEVPYPPLSTQHRIANILSRYDSLIENYQKQIKLLEDAAQRLYKEWFVDLRFPGHENTNIIDGVPEGWEKKKVKEVCDTTSGGTPSRSKTEFYTGDILWVKTKELNDDFIFDTEEKITEDAIRNSSAKMVPSGSILMAMYGATIGKLGIATKELSCNQACCVFLLPEDSTLRLYLYNWLLNSRTLLISMGKGAAQPNLSQDMIKNLEVVIPSSCLLAKFDSKVKPLYRIMSYHSSQIRLLTEARDRLLPKMMSGEIKIESLN